MVRSGARRKNEELWEGFWDNPNCESMAWTLHTNSPMRPSFMTAAKCVVGGVGILAGVGSVFEFLQGGDVLWPEPLTLALWGFALLALSSGLNPANRPKGTLLSAYIQSRKWGAGVGRQLRSLFGAAAGG